MRVILHAISPRLATRIFSMRCLEVFPWEKARAARTCEWGSVISFLRSNVREAMVGTCELWNGVSVC